MDQFQANRVELELAERGLPGRVVVAPDLWDLRDFASVILPSPPRGERELKLDLIEHAYHALQRGGHLAVLSPIAKDQLYPAVVKKVFGKAVTECDGHGTVVWSVRNGDHKHRRHEVTFSAKVADGDYREFLSRPGLFAYGRLDDGTRALLDVLEVRPNERILEIGCGCGVAGIIAALRSGHASQLTMIDSNARAVAVAQANVQRHQVSNATVMVSVDGAELPGREFDLVVANPPYFAQQTIAAKFTEQARRVLKPSGRFYLVTKQLDAVLPIMEEFFGEPLVLERRGYAVIIANRHPN
jgi:16S rRNA (guanine1207-N2)-methyltransferase